MNQRFQDYLLQPRLSWLTVGGALCAASLLVLLCRSVIDHPPTYDELLHILSARGILETGDPRIADGYYARAEIFSHLVALAFSHFGDTPMVARIPALLAGAVLIAMVVWWTSVRAGLVAGLASGIFLSILPTTVELAVFSRFYTLHALSVFVCAICAFEATRRSQPNYRLVLYGLAFVGSSLLAFHLQITTLIALMAIGAGVVGLLLHDLRSRWAPIIQSRPWHFVFGSTAALCAVIAVTTTFGPTDRFDQAPLWAANKSDAIDYYIQKLGRSLPLLWPLFPLAAIAAFLRHRNRRIAFFCLAVFGVVVLVHSFAAQKAMRYIFYALPFMCIVMGLGLSAAIEKILGTFSRTPTVHQEWALAAVLAFATLTLVLSQEGQLALRWFTGKPTGLNALTAYASESNWDTSSLADLAAAAQTADRVVASSGVKALHYLGRYDYEINASVVLETDTGEENGLDPRTGRHVIGRADSLAKVISRSGSTLVVVDDDKLGHWSGVPEDAIDILDQRCRNLGLPVERLVHAWVCFQQ